jgi:hypothetical protein
MNAHESQIWDALELLEYNFVSKRVMIMHRVVVNQILSESETASLS